jgi:hypothetical protein
MPSGTCLSWPAAPCTSLPSCSSSLRNRAGFRRPDRLRGGKSLQQNQGNRADCRLPASRGLERTPGVDSPAARACRARWRC